MELHRQVQLIHTDLAIVKPGMGIVRPVNHEAPVFAHPPVNLADGSAKCGPLGSLGQRPRHGLHGPHRPHWDQLHGLYRGWGLAQLPRGCQGAWSQTAPRMPPQSLSSQVCAWLSGLNLCPSGNHSQAHSHARFAFTRAPATQGLQRLWGLRAQALIKYYAQGPHRQQPASTVPSCKPMVRAKASTICGSSFSQ